jgi:choline dehydrogenase-like flavoprotein
MAYIPYHSGSYSDEQATSPERLAAPEAVAALALPTVNAFRVFFQTQSLRPNHQVTVRNATDGWERDIHGTYRDGTWVFEFERTRYPDQLEMKFLLDGTFWMSGFNMTLPNTSDHHFDEQSIQFPGASLRPLHRYDNLRTENTVQQQERIRSNLRSGIVYDVVVVGSGFGGGVLADALSDKGRNVLVLEAGSLIYPSHITNLPGDWPALPAYHQVGHFLNQPGSQFLFGVQMNLGGRSVFWSGLIPRMRDWELIFWPTPIRDYLTLSGYAAAEATLRKRRTLGPFQNATVAKLRGQFPDDNVEDLPQSLHQPNLGNNDQLGNVLEKSTGIFSTADLLLDSLAYSGLAGRDNLTINLNHQVVRVVTSGAKATEVVCRDLVGNLERRYRGKAVVLAAGSLESPRIALRSGLPDPNAKIGRGLTDHPAFFSREYGLPLNSEFGGLGDHAKVFMSHKQASLSQHGYNVEVLINPKYWDVRHPDDDVRKQRIDSITKSSIRMPFIHASHLDDDNVIQDLGPDIKASVKVKPNLSGSGLFNEVRSLRNDILTFLHAEPFDPSEGMHFGNEGTPHHAGGTLRVSGNSTGVVDTDLKFDALDNLYVADNSIFPFIPAANPALTLSALSLRLADHLHSTL